jgi:hypothetical protein
MWDSQRVTSLRKVCIQASGRQQPEIWNPSPHSMGVLALWESSKTTFCDFGIGAHADLRKWPEQRCVDIIPNKTVQRSEQLGLTPELASLRESRRSEP